MLELETITSETSIDPKELKDLLARLANPSADAPNGTVRIKDIAETLEVKEDEVIRQLTLLRTKKHDELIAQQARIQAQTPVFFATGNTQQQRVALATLFFALLVGFLMFFLLLSPPAMLQPEQAVPAAPMAAPHAEIKTP